MHRNSDHSQGATLSEVLTSMLSYITQKASMSRTITSPVAPQMSLRRHSQTVAAPIGEQVPKSYSRGRVPNESAPVNSDAMLQRVSAALFGTPSGNRRSTTVRGALIGYPQQPVPTHRLNEFRSQGQAMAGAAAPADDPLFALEMALAAQVAPLHLNFPPRQPLHQPVHQPVQQPVNQVVQQPVAQPIAAQRAFRLL